MTPLPPLPNSYWLPGHAVAAGEYPGSISEEHAAARLTGMLDAGIRSFVDLTEDRDGLEPYEPLLRRLSIGRALDVRYRRFGVRDMNTPSRDLMARILDYIVAEVADGRPVYVHCWGGVGRTGTVAGCLLTRTGLGCQEALELVGTLFRSLPPAKVARFPGGSPQTNAQRDFVLNWSNPNP